MTKSFWLSENIDEWISQLLGGLSWASFTAARKIGCYLAES
jgi:hypothetical protein